MRIKVDLIRISKRNKIPLNYLHEMSTFLHGLLSISKRRSIVQDTNLHFRRAKCLTFSLLQVPERVVIHDYLIVRGTEAYFYVSSPERTLLEHIKNGLFETGVIDFAGVKFKVRNIRAYPGPKFVKGFYRFSTLSPIILISQNHNHGSKFPIRYLYVTDAEFQEALRINLLKRFISYYAQVPLDSTFEIQKIHRFKPVTYQVKKRYYRGNRIIFDVYSSPELLRFAYDSGLGEETHFGFGMLKYLAHLKFEHRNRHKKEEVLQEIV